MKITFEDVNDDQVQLILESYLKGKLYFSDRLKLVKDGEENIKNKVKDLLEKYESELYKQPLTRSGSLVFRLIIDLNKLVKE